MFGWHVGDLRILISINKALDLIPSYLVSEIIVRFMDLGLRVANLGCLCDI